MRQQMKYARDAINVSAECLEMQFWLLGEGDGESFDLGVRGCILAG